MNGAAWVCAGGLGLAAACAGVCAGSLRWPRVCREEITTPKIDTGRELRILHLSDLHGDSPSRMNVDVWKVARSLEFDMAALTGDMIVRDMRELAPHRDGIRALAARVPVFFVEGNHDALYAKRMKEWMKSVGVRALYNEAARVRVGGVTLAVVGLRDYLALESQGFEPVSAAFAGASGWQGFTLALTHQPQLFDRLVPFGPDLTLAGHTHGGQVRLPFFPALYAPGQGIFPKYGDGWYESGPCKMYVSRGVGATHFPLRFWNRPQITVITVRGADEGILQID